jgi:hypothetical protein
MSAVYGAEKKVCALTISGPISERELFRVFDAVAPATWRGRNKQDFIECMAGCIRNVVYEEVDLSTGVLPNQSSEPDAIITFRRPDCDVAAQHAREYGLKIKTEKETR